jgi:hypothetical protein
LAIRFYHTRAVDFEKKSAGFIAMSFPPVSLMPVGSFEGTGMPENMVVYKPRWPGEQTARAVFLEHRGQS